MGLVEETGSLFAMSPDRFPLVVFRDSADTAGSLRSIDPPLEDSDKDFPPDVDSISRIAKARKLREFCKNGGSTDIRCLTGVRKLGSDSQSRLSRLLDGAPSVLPPPVPHRNSNQVDVDPRDDSFSPDSHAPDTPLKPPPARSNDSGTPRLDDRPNAGLVGMSGSTQAFSAFALCAIVVLVWMSVRKFLSPSSSLPPQTKVSIPIPHEVSDTTTKPLPELPPLEPLEEIMNGHGDVPPEDPTPPLDPAKKVLFAPEALEPVVDGANDAAEGEDSDKEGDATDTPGKKKGIRRKRGKKKKGAVTIAVPAEEGEQAAELVPNGVPETPKPPSSIVLMPSTPPAPVVRTLIVSDQVLGKYMLCVLRFSVVCLH